MANGRRYDPATRTLILSNGPDELWDLRQREGLRTVLDALREEPRVETLVLSQVKERRYGRHAVAGLNALLSLLRLGEQLATRDPSPEFPGESPRKTRARCAACPFQPRTLFARLTQKVVTSLQEFHAEFALQAQALARRREPGCAGCIDLTRRDLEILLARYQALQREVSGP